jgi:hypothetical protein
MSVTVCDGQLVMFFMLYDGQLVMFVTVDGWAISDVRYGLKGGGEGDANFYRYTLQHSFSIVFHKTIPLI